MRFERSFMTIAAVAFGCWLTPSIADEKEKDREGTVTGLAAAKGGNWIEVKADGEERARRYYTGSDPVALKAVKTTDIGSRIRMDWRFREVFRVVKIEVLKPPMKKD